MKILTYLILVIFGIAVGFAVEYAMFLHYGLRELPSKFQVFGTIAVSFGVTVAFIVYIYNVLRHRREDMRRSSETYLEEARSLLDKAYETFIRQGDYPPKNDRLLWLSTARMLVSSQNLKKNITERSHIHVMEENEEFYRVKFRSLFDRNKHQFTKQYFFPSGEIGSVGNIAPTSMAVLFGFARWKDGKEDPLGHVDMYEIFADRATLMNQPGAEEYVQIYDKIWEKIIRRREENAIAE